MGSEYEPREPTRYLQYLDANIYIYIYIYKSFRKINSFGFGIAFSILFLGNKSCFYIVLVDESDLQRDKVANILDNFVWYIYIYIYIYGWEMSQPLPTGEFCWVDIKPDEISKLMNLSMKGYLLEVDVHYPRELHDYHNDLPFMCECMLIGGVEKLIPNLYYKKRYVIHIRALNQALKHGLVLERIHRAIEFKQLAWMKEYIDFNTKLRTAAANDFEKDFYKLMNNSVFDKTMEKTRKHRNIKLVTN